MEDKEIKDGIDRYIGTEKLFNHQIKNQILSNVGKRRNAKGISRMNKFMPAFVLLLLIFGGITFFLMLDDPATMTPGNKGTTEPMDDPVKEIPESNNTIDEEDTKVDEVVTPPANEETSEIIFDLESHGTEFPELKSDLNVALASIKQTLAISVNGVSINEEGTVVVDLNDFRQDLGNLTTNEKGEFLWPLYNSVFKYPEVKEVYFTFNGSFTAWYEWLESTPDPMIRQDEQVMDNTSKLVDALLVNHTYYSDMYQFIQEANMPDAQAGSVFILYLEALKNGDVEQIREYSVNNNDTQIAASVSIYEQIDYNSFTIEQIVPSQGEPIYDVHLNYKQKDGSSGDKVIYMQFYDDKISIFDNPEN